MLECCELRLVRVCMCVSMHKRVDVARLSWRVMFGTFYQVTSPYGNNLHHNENVTHGQFAFTTTESGNYLACFWVGGQHQDGASTSLNLEWKTGISAKNWETVARKEKIEACLSNQLLPTAFIMLEFIRS